MDKLPIIVSPEKAPPMKYSIRLSALVIVSALFFLSACKNDDPESKACEGGVLEMTFNGAQVDATSFNNTLVKGISGGSSGKRMDIRATQSDGKQLIITFTDLSTGSNGNCVSLEEYISFDDITTGSENTFLFTVIDNGISESFTDGNLDVISCDADAKTVSGTFSFSQGDTQVTNGSFTEVCYSVL